MSFTRDDYISMYATVYGEARGEGYDGMVAVAWVILNRVHSPRWPNKPVDVVKQSRQFSCWNDDDVNYPHTVAIIEADDMIFFRETSRFGEVMTAVMDSVKGAVKDPTKGSTHYHTKDTHPVWSRGKIASVVIGNHKFYNNIK